MAAGVAGTFLMMESPAASAVVNEGTMRDTLLSKGGVGDRAVAARDDGMVDSTAGQFGDMRFAKSPVDRRISGGPEKLVLRSGVATLKVAEPGTEAIETYRNQPEAEPKMRYNRDVTIRGGRVDLTYHTHWTSRGATFAC